MPKYTGCHCANSKMSRTMHRPGENNTIEGQRFLGQWSNIYVLATLEVSVRTNYSLGFRINSNPDPS